MLAEQPELAVQLGVAGRQHAAVAGGDAPCGGGTRSRRRSRAAGRSAPRPAHERLAADRAGRVLDHRQAVSPGDVEDGRQVARQADLVHGQDRPGPRRDRPLDQGGVDVVGPRVDVHEHRAGAAVADGVGGGDERVADRDHLVAGPDAEGEQGQVQRRRAARDGAGVRRADVRGELLLEGRDLRPLRDPAGEDRPAGRRGLLLAQARAGDRDLPEARAHRATASRPETISGRHAARRRRPSSSGTSATKPSSSAGPRRVGQPPGHRVDLPRRVELRRQVVGPRHLLHRPPQPQERRLGPAGDVVDVIVRSDRSARMLARAMSST